MNPVSAAELLAKGLQDLEIEVSGPQTGAFLGYLQELKKWNSAYNLTALKNDEDIIVKHFLDSLLYLKALPAGELKLADAGAGAGFPGIPIKIVRPEIQLSLIEPSRKKTSFLRHICRKEGIKDVRVIQERIENLPIQYKAAFDVIVSRATFSILKFMSTACPFVREGGSLILSKGPAINEELEEMEQHRPGHRQVSTVLPFRLPIQGAQRNIIILKC